MSGRDESLLQVPPRLLKAGELQAVADARALLERARAEAERLRAEAEQAREAARQAGYREGVTAGQRERAEQMLVTVTGVVEYLAALEDELVALVVDSVRRILLACDDEALARRLVRAGLARLHEGSRVTLRAAPATAERFARALSPDQPEAVVLRVVEDTRLAEGQCVLESEIGVVEIGIDQQLEALRRALRSRLRHAAPDGEAEA